jgi:hypothetical protein
MKVKEWIKVLNKMDPEETICVHYWLKIRIDFI